MWIVYYKTSYTFTVSPRVFADKANDRTRKRVRAREQNRTRERGGKRVRRRDGVNDSKNWKRSQRPSNLTLLSQLDTLRPREGMCPGRATEQFRSELTHWPVACSLLCNSCLFDQK